MRSGAFDSWGGFDPELTPSRLVPHVHHCKTILRGNTFAFGNKKVASSDWSLVVNHSIYFEDHGHITFRFLKAKCVLDVAVNEVSAGCRRAEMVGLLNKNK